MKLKAEDLESHLKQQLAQVYVVSGDEPLQLGESVDLIRARAREQGYAERQVYSVERNFDWGQLYAGGNTLSLFSQKILLELRMGSAKPGDAGSKALIEFAQHLNPDTVLIISLPKVDKKIQASKWFAALEKVGVFIQIWPVEITRLPQWISQRMRMRGMAVSRDAAQLLADRVEGNLLAAAQEIEKLALNYQGEVQLEEMADAISDSVRFDVFALVEAILQGDKQRIVRIMDVLKSTGVEPILVEWAIMSELRLLSQLAASAAKGKSVDQQMKEKRIWDSRARLLKMALQRSKAGYWNTLILAAARLDRTIKGMMQGNTWDELLKLSLAMGGIRILPN